jgi:hypothetical protein
MKALEEKVTSLTEAIENRFQKLEELVATTKKASSSSVVRSETLEAEPVVDSSSSNLLTGLSEELLESGTDKQESGLDSELPQEGGTGIQGSTLQSELPIELLISVDTQQLGKAPGIEEGINSNNGQEVGEVIKAGKPDSSLPVDQLETTSGETLVIEDCNSNSESPSNTQSVPSHHQSELPFGLSSNLLTDFSPISSVKLSKRLGKGEQSVKHMKRKYKDDIQKFTDWSQGEDPDKIAWEYEPNTKKYIPIGELTDEQKGSLLRWYEENP